MPLDLAPAAQQLSALLSTISDEQLGSPTPCPEYTLGDLVDHIGGLSLAFAAGARKEPPTGGPSGDASRLGDDWRSRIPAQLDDLVVAWHDPDAWTGTTHVGIELPGAVAGVVAADELVLHGWDVAASIGQPFTVEPALLDAVEAFVADMTSPERAGQGVGLFGPPVDVPMSARRFDRVLGRAGRDPGWAPPT